MFECPGQLVRATCTPSFAVDTIQQGYDILNLAAYAQSGHSLGVSVATLGVLDFTDNVPFGLYVYRFRTYDRASPEEGLPDSVFSGIVQERHIISDSFHIDHLSRNIRKKIPVLFGTIIIYCIFVISK